MLFWELYGSAQGKWGELGVYIWWNESNIEVLLLFIYYSLYYFQTIEEVNDLQKQFDFLIFSKYPIRVELWQNHS